MYFKNIQFSQQIISVPKDKKKEMNQFHSANKVKSNFTEKHIDFSLPQCSPRNRAMHAVLYYTWH